jgi:hypothetical protein
LFFSSFKRREMDSLTWFCVRYLREGSWPPLPGSV